jgi:arabinose-5-phosphate isomerase
MSLDTARRVLNIEVDALYRLSENLDEAFLKAVEWILTCKGRLVVTGIGKSGIVGHKISSTLASTGTPSIVLHPSEALHGDLGMVKENDIVLAISNSGGTEEFLQLVPIFKRMGVRVIAMTGNPESALADIADLHLNVSIDHEACPLGLAPMASTTAQMAMGDALAAVLIERRGFQAEDFARLHPGGKLGKRLMRVEELMRRGEELPKIAPDLPMKEVILIISEKRLGLGIVVKEDRSILGIITDGDLRRLLEQHGGALLEMTALDCSSPGPVTIAPETMAVEALNFLESRKITSLLVVDEREKLIGVLHLHDLWGVQLI